jgi:hypothetical protein
VGRVQIERPAAPIWAGRCFCGKKSPAEQIAPPTSLRTRTNNMQSDKEMFIFGPVRRARPQSSVDVEAALGHGIS